MDRTVSSAATLVGVATAAIVLMAGFAFAEKPVTFTGSRAAVQETCELNHGAYIDKRPETGDYGCFTQNGWIWCAADGTCEGGRQSMRGPAGSGVTAWPVPGEQPQGASGQLTAWPWMKTPLPDEQDNDDDPLVRLLGPDRPDQGSAQPGS